MRILSLCLMVAGSAACELQSGKPASAADHDRPASNVTNSREPSVSAEVAFDPFWAEFQQAVRLNDRSTLYRLTRHSGFIWLKDDLKLERHGEYNRYYRFRSEEEFHRVYGTIFSSSIRKKLQAVTPVSYSDGQYYASLKDRSFTYEFLFHVDDGQFRYSGMQIGPP